MIKATNNSPPRRCSGRGHGPEENDLMDEQQPTDAPPPRDPVEVTRRIREAPTFEEAVAIVKTLTLAELNALTDLALEEGR
jgi:hypothetical protein